MRNNGIIVLLLASAMSCTSSLLTKETVVSEAFIVNALPVDGCDWHLQINKENTLQQVVPTEATKSKIQAIIDSAKSEYGVYRIKTEVRYRLTPNKQKVQCGWGKQTDMEEIEIVEIKQK